MEAGHRGSWLIPNAFYRAKETIEKMTTYRMRENICKLYDQLRVNIQHIETVHTTQIKKKSNLKMDRGSFFPKEDIKIIKRHIKICSISLKPSQKGKSKPQ